MIEENENSAKSVTGAEYKSWKNPPKVSDLKQNFIDATPSHSNQTTKISTWLDNLNVTGGAKVNTGDGNSKIVPKLIRKQAEWRYAALSEPFLSTRDLFNVSPISWEDREAAQQNQIVLNNQFNTRLNKVKFIDEYVRTAVDEGTAIVRVGWDFQEITEKVMVPTVEFRPNPALAPMFEELSQMQATNPTRYMLDVPDELKQAHELSLSQGLPYEPIITGYAEEEQTKTVRNQPTLEVCDYRNTIIDPSCQGDLDKAGFIIYSFNSSLSDLEKDGRYFDLTQINIEANSPLGDPDHASEDTQDFKFNDQARKQFVVYEYWGYWDIDDTGIAVPIVAAWVGDTLIRMEKNPYPDKKAPFIAVQYLPVRRSVYGEPDGHLLEDNQKVAGAVTRGMIDLMGKSANGQTGTRKDALDVTNKRKFVKGQDYEFNAHVDPRQAIFMHTYPEIPASAQFMLQLQNAEAESLTGVKAFTGGISGEALGTTATGIRGALDAASKRELGILRRLASGMTDIARKIISMNAVFLEEREVVRVTNEEFVTVNRDDLAGNFDLNLSISTAEEDNAKAQELSFMLQTMGNNMDPGMSKMILSDIARLRKMPDLAKSIEMYQPQPDPFTQQKQQLELQLLQAQIANEMSQARENDSEAMLDMAKAGTEQARTRALGSDADLKDLNFVEQESGVTQERDLQKLGAQANANIKLKQVEAGLKAEDRQESQLDTYLKKLG